MIVHPFGYVIARIAKNGGPRLRVSNPSPESLMAVRIPTWPFEVELREVDSSRIIRVKRAD